MSKIILSDVAAGYNLQKINDNFDKLSDTINNDVLFRRNPTGEPNQMVASNLDMDSNRILNLPTPVDPNEPARLQDLKDLAVDKFHASAIDFTPTATITSPNVQDAVEEVDSNARKKKDEVSIIDYGAKCDFSYVDNSGTDDSAAFQAVCNAVPALERWVVKVPRTTLINSVVSPGAGEIIWDFDIGAEALGPGKLPFHSGVVTYNSTPNRGKRINSFHGTIANPTKDGVVASNYRQRIDQSITADDPGHLIYNDYSVLKRLNGGTGWCTTSYNYLEDGSTSGAAQSTAVTGAAFASGNAQIWGVYGEATATAGSTATATGAEFDCFNSTSTDYSYNPANPVNGPHSKALWLLGAGSKANTFAFGFATTGTATMFGAGIYMAANAVKQYGIDMQAKPQVGIQLHGASTDGTGTTPGGIGIDVGAKSNTSYGTGLNQAAIHLRDQALAFDTGTNTANYGYIQYNPNTVSLDFWHGGVLRKSLDLNGSGIKARMSSFNTSAQSLPSGGFTTITGYTTEYDINNCFVPATGTYTCVGAGMHDIRFSVRCTAATPIVAGAQVLGALFVNGIQRYTVGSTYSTSTVTPQLNGSFFYNAGAGDILTLRVFNNTGVSLTLDGSSPNNFLQIQKMDNQ